jgi:peptidoglycan pentaglycine glycine transferase (the first glycine)
MMTKPDSIRPQHILREFLDGTQMVLLRSDEQVLWERLLTSSPQSHLLQCWAWGEIKQAFGWTPLRVALWDPESLRLLAGAQVLLHPLPLLGSSLAYVPKGPVLDWADPSCYELFFAGLHAFLRSQRAAFLRVEPDLPSKICPSRPEQGQVLAPVSSSADEALEPLLGGLSSMRQGNAVARHLHTLGFHPAQDSIQQLRTIVVDLTPDEAIIRQRQKPKWRYNANLAARKGVTVRQASSRSDLERWYEVFALTRKRDGFESRSLAYFQQLVDLLSQAGQGALFLAEYEGQLLAGILVTRVGRRGIYLYGASGNEGRHLMPNHLLQWEAMRWAKAQGATLYDLWGIAETDDPADPLAGVTQFKRGWGGQVVEYLGGFDYVYAPAAYRAFRAGRKLAKALTNARAGFMRRR